MHHVNFKAKDLDLLQHLWDKGRTPVKIDILKLEPENYDNREEAAYLLSGFIEGFRLHYSGPRISTFSDNLISAQTHISETKEKLLKETEFGRMLSPFSPKPISTLRVLPIGLVPKSSKGMGVALKYPFVISRKL